jgi:transcriptional regulator with XRE-family HTH domain
MAQTGSPTLRRWELARLLRQLREASGRTIDEVAQELLCSTSKISRIETGARGASSRDVRDLSRLYGADEATSAYLMRLSREAKQRGWWQHFDQVFPDYTTFMGFEEAASSIQDYEASVVPGLLQTADYTRALMQRVFLTISADSVEQYVSSRQQRQERILRSDPASFWAILDEAVLHREVGGRKVMRDQLEHLARCATDRRVQLQILPFAAGAHAGMAGSFILLQFEEVAVPDLVYVEGRAGQMFLSRDEDVKLYHRTFDHLRASADSLEGSVERLHAVLESWS